MSGLKPKETILLPVSGQGFGYVYVMSYPGSPHIKIGHSLNPSNRADDIGGTLGPETPVVEAYYWCSERRQDVERATHQLEQNSRYNGEWFTIPIDQALESIKDAAAEVGVQIQLTYDRNELAQKVAATAAAKQKEIELEATERLRQEEFKAERERIWLEHEPERIRLEKVRLWKLNEPERLQRRNEASFKITEVQDKKLGVSSFIEKLLKWREKVSSKKKHQAMRRRLGYDD